jgi:nucleoside-diphosphate kinase
MPTTRRARVRTLMAIERTFSIIKPDAVAKNVIGPIVAKLEAAGLRVIASRMVRLTDSQAKAFYAVHKERPFYKDLVKFMTEGPVVVQVLEGESAVARNREVMGATNPEKAAAGTIRKEFATNIERNAVHGSDGPDTARDEIAFFFSTAELAALER